MVKGGPRDDAQPQQLIPQVPESPTESRRRNRSPQEWSDPSSKRRRSQRLEDQKHGHETQDRADASARASPDPLAKAVIDPSAQAEQTTSDLESTSPGPTTIAKSSSPEGIPSGTIRIALNRRPPLQVRTGVSIPRVSVRVTISGSDNAESGPLDIGTLHAVVSLWSADGRVASPHAVPPLLTGHKDATLVDVASAQRYERQVEARFSDLAITRPGYYRIRISVMETPFPDRDEDSDSTITSPRQLLSIETRPIHAHAFVPMSRRSPGRRERSVG